MEELHITRTGEEVSVVARICLATIFVAVEAICDEQRAHLAKHAFLRTGARVQVEYDDFFACRARDIVPTENESGSTSLDSVMNTTTMSIQVIAHQHGSVTQDPST